MKKIISFVGLFAVLGVGIGDAHGVAMSAQVRRLLQEKQEKIEQLEKCEGKKQGWMIAGISTIGLTAVGVGVNIAQASKSNRLSSEIEMEKSTLERHQNELNRIQNNIAAEQLRQRREDCKKQSGKRWNENGYCEDVPGTGGGNGGTAQVIEPTQMPALDNPDGEIGKLCGDNGGGIWTEKTDGTKKCSNVNGLVLCECVKGTTATPSGGMGDGNVSSSSNTEKSSTSTATSGGTNSKSVTTSNSEKSSSNAANIDDKTSDAKSVSPVDNIMELARYKGYEVQCNGDDEKFEFVNDVPGADEQILRIKTDCNGKITEKTSSMQYTDTSGNTTTHATTVIICKCDKRRDFSVSESGLQKLSGGTSQESKWHILEQADRGYGVTRDYFCNQVQDKSKYIAFTVRADFPNVSALIEQGAGMGYWCKQLDGTWTVERPYGINGREWKCGNLDVVKSKCNPQKADTKPVVEKNSVIDFGLKTGVDLAIKNAQSNVTSKEQNKDMQILNSTVRTPGAFSVNLPSTDTTKKSEPTAIEKFEAEAASITQCETNGGWVGPFGGCNCPRAKGLTRSSDKKSCVCEKSGYVYNRSKGKCIAPNREDVSEFIDELEANSKDRFL